MKDKEYNEIRLNEKGDLDDIAIYDMHLEDMTGKFWWLGYYDKNEKENLKRTTFHITSKSKISVALVENELKSKIVKYKIRK